MTPHNIFPEEDQTSNVRPGRLKRRIFRISKVLILVYCSIGIALYYLQEKFLFHPDPLPADYAWTFNRPFEEFNIALSKNENLNVIRFLAKDSIAKGAILYFHGNKGNINHYQQAAENLSNYGYEVWMMDYAGFGKSTGTLSEKGMYHAAVQLYKLANSRFSPDSLIVYGRSLGSGPAAYLGANYPVRMLILETPFYSVPELFSNYAPIYPTERMSTFKFPVGEYLGETKIPVIIFHGDKDEVVPFSSAEKLKKELKAGDHFYMIPEGKHNDLGRFPLFKEKMDSIFKKLTFTQYHSIFFYDQFMLYAYFQGEVFFIVAYREAKAYRIIIFFKVFSDDLFHGFSKRERSVFYYL